MVLDNACFCGIKPIIRDTVPYANQPFRAEGLGRNAFAAIMKKTIIITGATSGIGLETTRLLAGKGYCILAVGHSTANCEKADRDIRFGIPDADISWFAGDLMQQREVVRVAGEIKKRLNENGTESLYALINNAGCTRSRYMTTEDGYEQQFALNHLAGFRLTHELLPYLLKEGGRVIMTSSESHKNMKVRWSDVMMRKHYKHAFRPGTERPLRGQGATCIRCGSGACEHGHRKQNNRNRGFCVEIPQTLRSASIRLRTGLSVPVRAM